MIILYSIFGILLSIYLVSNCISGFYLFKNYISTSNFFKNYIAHERNISMLEMDECLSSPKKINKNLKYSEEVLFIHDFFTVHLKNFSHFETLDVERGMIERDLSNFKKRFVKTIIDAHNLDCSSDILNKQNLRVKSLFSFCKEYNETNTFTYIVNLESTLSYLLRNPNTSKELLNYAQHTYNNYLYDLVKSLYIYYKNSTTLQIKESRLNIELFQESVEQNIKFRVIEELNKANSYKKEIDVNFLLTNFSTKELDLKFKFEEIDNLCEKILSLSENDLANIEIKVVVSNMKSSVIPRLKTWSGDKSLKSKDLKTISIVLDKIIEILKGYKSNLYIADNGLLEEILVIDRYLGYLDKGAS